MIREYDETFFSKLNIDLQESLYLLFNKVPPRDKIMLFTRYKYGEEITFKDISEKMHFSTARNVYAKYLETIKSGIL